MKLTVDDITVDLSQWQARTLVSFISGVTSLVAAWAPIMVSVAWEQLLWRRLCTHYREIVRWASAFCTGNRLGCCKMEWC